MSAVVSRRMLVKTDVKANNNKYWEGVLYDNNDVVCRWGRVGAAKGQEKTFSGVGQTYLEKKIREKTKKGYKEVEGINSGGATAKVEGSRLKSVAKKQIRSSGCKTTDKLIDYLVQVNRHEIKTASGGKLTVNEDGLIKTDVGVVVTQDTLDRARGHLVVLSKCVSKKDFASSRFIDTLNEYLMAIPQKVGARRGWEKSFLVSGSDIQRQGALIDSMEATLQAYNDAPVVAGGTEDTVFNVELTKISDKKEIDRVNKLYRKTLQRRHSCSHLKVKNVFNVHIEHMAAAFEDDGAKKAPVMELWHGTRASNLLSILKCGLVIPPANAAHVCGRVFGNGAYFSDQSTKSLNYAYGYWDGGRRDNKCYMLLADVGMGKSYTPRGPIRKMPAGYDSVFAVGGKSGVLNNEMIVPRVSQCNLTRLIEFGA